MRNATSTLFIGISLFLAACGNAIAVQYRAIDLGIPGASFSYAKSINDAGVIVGAACNAGDTWEHAFMWRDQTPSELDLVSCSYSSASSINGLGQTVGVLIDDLGYYRLFLRQQNGTVQYLASSPIPFWPDHIDDSGRILVSVEGYAHVWQDGMPDRRLDDTYGNEAFDSNSSGWIAGTGLTENGNRCALLWKGDGPARDLSPSDGYGAAAYGINESGTVAGSAYIVNPDDIYDRSIHATVWLDGTMQDLGTLGGRESRAMDINDAGVVVGVSTDASNNDRAFVWSDGAMQDLDTLGGHSAWAAAVNNKGQIVGWAQTANGEQHAVLWQPVPEPSSMLALLAGLAGSGVVLRRRT